MCSCHEGSNTKCTWVGLTPLLLVSFDTFPPPPSSKDLVDSDTLLLEEDLVKPDADSLKSTLQYLSECVCVCAHVCTFIIVYLCV